LNIIPIKLNLKEIRQEGVPCVHRLSIRNKSRLCEHGNEPLAPIQWWEYSLTCWETIGVSRKSPFYCYLMLPPPLHLDLPRTLCFRNVAWNVGAELHAVLRYNCGDFCWHNIYNNHNN
jgi:hypothetical protein